jgi:[ribosomal protein S18]-alanine N-acetyltransferase
VLVRAYRSEDAFAMHRLAKSVPEAAQWTIESYERLLEESQQGWLVEQQKLLFGFLVARILSPDMEIMNLAVLAQWRRKGIAAALLATAENEGRAKKVTRIFLEVRQSNAGAMAFYEGRGFRKMSRRAGYYQDPQEAAILMEKELTA